MGIIKYDKLDNNTKIESNTFYLYDIFQLINTKLDLNHGSLYIECPDDNNICLICNNQKLERLQEHINTDTIINGLTVDLNNYITIVKNRKPIRESKITYGNIENICNNIFNIIIIYSLDDNSEIKLDLSNDIVFNYDIRNLYLTEAVSFEFDDNILKINVDSLW